MKNTLGWHVIIQVYHEKGKQIQRVQRKAKTMPKPQKLKKDESNFANEKKKSQRALSNSGEASFGQISRSTCTRMMGKKEA